MWKEFKEFISQGNVIDLATGVIIGSAFTAIVNSLVNDILMPVIGVIIGGLDFSGLSITVGSAVIGYGAFIQAVINFLIIAGVIFLLLKSLKVLKKPKETPEEEEVSAEDKQVALLEEIRDQLAKK